ncbi:MAG TPA: hypothetical protein VK841_13825 [Polyangiaceae bacterium]|jgi:hypothetical protein|nr:hypothetical protein [Polyangiaceae bacterium]
MAQPRLSHTPAEVVQASARWTANDDGDVSDDDEEVEVFEADEDVPPINPDRPLAADRLEAFRPQHTPRRAHRSHHDQ